MSDLADKVKKSLSEVRTLVLGAQILLGFQYQSILEPGFASMGPAARAGVVVGLILLIAAVVLLIAPTSFNRIAEGGEATARQCRFTDRAISLALPPFAAGIGVNLAVVTRGVLDAPLAMATGATAVALALFLWFGVPLMVRKPKTVEDTETVKLSLKEKITEMLTETRIVLPGVQALLGFQLAAYLTEAFRKLGALDKSVHTAGLLLLVAAMILLMTPAPFHRLADRGDDSARADRVGVACILAALAALGLALGADAFVVLDVAGAKLAIAAIGSAAAAAGALIVWFAVPLAARNTAAPPAHSHRQP